MAPRRKSPVEHEHIEPQMCTVDLRLSILRQLPFFQGLTDQAIGEINPIFREQGYDASAFIHFAGDRADRLYVVVAGRSS